MGLISNVMTGSGRVLFCWSRGAVSEIWMNPMRPSIVDLSSPLPRPNHPKGTLVGWLGRGSGEVWVQRWMNPMRPSKSSRSSRTGRRFDPGSHRNPNKMPASAGMSGLIRNTCFFVIARSGHRLRRRNPEPHLACHFVLGLRAGYRQFAMTDWTHINPHDSANQAWTDGGNSLRFPHENRF